MTATNQFVSNIIPFPGRSVKEKKKSCRWFAANCPEARRVWRKGLELRFFAFQSHAELAQVGNIVEGNQGGQLPLAAYNRDRGVVEGKEQVALLAQDYGQKDIDN